MIEFKKMYKRVDFTNIKYPLFIKRKLYRDGKKYSFATPVPGSFEQHVDEDNGILQLVKVKDSPNRTIILWSMSRNILNWRNNDIYIFASNPNILYVFENKNLLPEIRKMQESENGSI
jgi:hypothetical protein